MASPKIKIDKRTRARLRSYMAGDETANLDHLRSVGIVHAQRRTLTAAGEKLWESMKVPVAQETPAVIYPDPVISGAPPEIMTKTTLHTTPVDWSMFEDLAEAEPTEPLQSEIRSNTQLAKHPLVRTTPTMASRLRSGKRQPSIDMANRVLTALSVSDAEFRVGMHAFAAGGDVQAGFFDRHMGRWGKTGTAA